MKANCNNVSVPTTATAGMALTMFTPELACELDNLAKRSDEMKDYTTGCLIFCLSAAKHPQFLSAASRLQSLAASIADGEAQIRRRWSDAGFFQQQSAPDDDTDPKASLRRRRTFCCFHCGASCYAGGSEQPEVEPLQLHRQLSPNCELARLLAQLATPAIAVAVAADARPSAARLRSATAKLLADLATSQLLERVESYGFERRLAAFCACRLFMTGGGRLSARPGDLMQAVYDSEELLLALPQGLDLEAALKTLGDSVKAPASVAETEQTQPQPQQAKAATKSDGLKAAPPAHAPSNTNNAASITQSVVPSAVPQSQARSGDADESPESELCTSCRIRTRDQVTLPCAHFALCRGCANERRDCPKCGREILALVRAFIA